MVLSGGGGCQENESCSKVLERLDDRIKWTHEETVAVVRPREDIGSNKGLYRETYGLN